MWPYQDHLRAEVDFRATTIYRQQPQYDPPTFSGINNVGQRNMTTADVILCALAVSYAVVRIVAVATLALSTQKKAGRMRWQVWCYLMSSVILCFFTVVICFWHGLELVSSRFDAPPLCDEEQASIRGFCGAVARHGIPAE
jgi:hypothetical protein